MKNKVFVPGFGVGEVEDLVVDPQIGDVGFAVRFEDGRTGDFCAGMVQAVNPSLPPINPFESVDFFGAVNQEIFNPKKQPYFPALGAVELDQPGQPDVFALRLPKIPKKQQLSDLLGVPVEWQSRGRVGFFVEGPAGIESLGYSFGDALTYAVQQDRDYGAFGGRVADLSTSDIQRLTEESELKKWGVINPSSSAPVVNQALVAPRPGRVRRPPPGDRFPPLDGRSGMVVQSILFPIEDWTSSEAQAWLSSHGFISGDPEYGATVIRFRQLDPEIITPGSFSTVQFGRSGIQAVVGIERGGLPSDWRPNPTGLDEQGQQVFYVRQAGPSGQMMLSASVGQDIRYHFPGDPESPDPSRGGFFSSAGVYLGKSFDSAYLKLFGTPTGDIEQKIFSGAVGAASSAVLAGGDTVLMRVQASPDYSSFLQSLSDKEKERLSKDAISLGFVGGLSDLYEHLIFVLGKWGRVVNPDPRFPNPPQFIEVSGKVKPFSFSIDTESGQVLGSEGLPGLSGLVVGPSLSDQYATAQDIATLEQADFSNIDQAWAQFEASALQSAREVPGASSLVSERDRTGQLFEGVSQFYERPYPLETLEDTVKYILRKERIKRWDDFPLSLLHQMGAPGLWDFLILPEGRTAQARIAVGMSPADLEQQQRMLQSMASDRFALLKTATDILGYYARRIEPTQAAGLVGFIRPFLADPADPSYVPPQFSQSDFQEFANLLKGALNVG